MYSSPNIISHQIEEEEMNKACSMNGEIRGAYKVLIGRPERKSYLENVDDG
jgi:hypothetical protein